MSWSLYFIAKTREEAIKEVEEQYKKQQPHFPAEAKDALIAHLELVSTTEGQGVAVASNGHFYGGTGGSSQEVKTVRLI